ncbi:MAG: ribosome maturation factor RimM [Acidimicrobiia bacterium]
MRLEVGRIGRAHGVRGDVVVTLITERLERLAPGAVLHADRGPLTVRSARPHQGGHIVSFEEIADRDAAERWRGAVLRAEALDDPGDELWVHEAVGATVVLADGTVVGVVEAIQANPAADLLVLDGGALVPAVFIVAHEPGRIAVDPPEGLFDL